MTASGTHTYNSDKSRDADMAVAGYLETVGLGVTHTNNKYYAYVAFLLMYFCSDWSRNANRSDTLFEYSHVTQHPDRNFKLNVR